MYNKRTSQAETMNPDPRNKKTVSSLPEGIFFFRANFIEKALQMLVFSSVGQDCPFIGEGGGGGVQENHLQCTYYEHKKPQLRY